MRREHRRTRRSFAQAAVPDGARNSARRTTSGDGYADLEQSGATATAWIGRRCFPVDAERGLDLATVPREKPRPGVSSNFMRSRTAVDTADSPAPASCRSMISL